MDFIGVSGTYFDDTSLCRFVGILPRECPRRLRWDCGCVATLALHVSL
jgi:hypothetical protein